jgi:hypothetical protein
MKLLLAVLCLSVSLFGQSPVILDNLEEQIFLTCGNCGNTGSAGAAATFTKQNTNEISRDGVAALFSVSAVGAPYANAYWYQKRVGTVAATHFEYEFDLWVPGSAATASNAIEFEVQQSLAGNTYCYAWQALFNGTKTWRYFDKVNRRWIDSKIPVTLAQDIWHHVKMEFARTADNRTGFTAITVDGKRSLVGVTEAAKPALTKDYLSNAFQLDTNKYGAPYAVVMDKLTLKYW